MQEFDLVEVAKVNVVKHLIERVEFARKVNHQSAVRGIRSIVDGVGRHAKLAVFIFKNLMQGGKGIGDAIVIGGFDCYTVFGCR